MGVGLVDVDVIKQLLVHEIAVGADVIGVQADVLVQVVGGDAGEIQHAGLVQVDQSLIGRNRGGAGGQAQYAVRVLQYLGLDQCSSGAADGLFRRKNVYLHCGHSCAYC